MVGMTGIHSGLANPWAKPFKGESVQRQVQFAQRQPKNTLPGRLPLWLVLGGFLASVPFISMWVSRPLEQSIEERAAAHPEQPITVPFATTEFHGRHCMPSPPLLPNQAAFSYCAPLGAPAAPAEPPNPPPKAATAPNPTLQPGISFGTPEHSCFPIIDSLSLCN